MREGTQPSQGPLASTSGYYKAWPEFTPPPLTALGPNFRKSGPSISLVHLDNFICWGWKESRCEQRGTFVEPRWNESLGWCCPEQCQDVIFFITSPNRNDFPLLSRIFALIGCKALNGLDSVFAAVLFECEGGGGDLYNRSSLGEILCPSFVPVMWIQDVSFWHILFLLWGLFCWVKSAFFLALIFSSHYPCRSPCSRITSKPQAVSYPTVLLVLFFPLIVPNILLQNHKLLKKEITGQEMAWPAVLKQAPHLNTHSHTHINALTHTSGFSFRCLSLYIFPVHPHTHNSLFIPSKSGPARPQPPRPNGPMNRNHVISIIKPFRTEGSMCRAFHTVPSVSSYRSGKSILCTLWKAREGKESTAVASHKRQLPSILLNSVSRWPGVDSCTVGTVFWQWHRIVYRLQAGMLKMKDPIGPNGGHGLKCNAWPLTIIMPLKSQ